MTFETRKHAGKAACLPTGFARPDRQDRTACGAYHNDYRGATGAACRLTDVELKRR
jgi:hypothetical protein